MTSKVIPMPPVLSAYVTTVCREAPAAVQREDPAAVLRGVGGKAASIDEVSNSKCSIGRAAFSKHYLYLTSQESFIANFTRLEGLVMDSELHLTYLGINSHRTYTVGDQSRPRTAPMKPVGEKHRVPPLPFSASHCAGTPLHTQPAGLAQQTTQQLWAMIRRGPQIIPECQCHEIRASWFQTKMGRHCHLLCEQQLQDGSLAQSLFLEGSIVARSHLTNWSSNGAFAWHSAF